MQGYSMLVVLVFALGSMGCSNDSGDGDTGPPPPTYENLAGDYSAPTNAVSRYGGDTLNGTFWLSLTQNAGTVGGTWAASGTLSDHGAHSPIALAGTISIGGVVASGPNPTVFFSLLLPSCPNVGYPFNGSYTSANERLTVQALIPLGLGDCLESLVIDTLTLVRQ
jgi:hypothetical protein